MQIAIETTGRTGSLAVLSGETVLRQTQLAPDARTAATLAPALDQTIKWCQSQEKQPEFVSVADGPGSFTGLRIGVTTAKTLCYATQLPLVAVDSIAAIAATVLAQSKVDMILVGINAYRGQVFTGTFALRSLLPPWQQWPPGNGHSDWSPRPDHVRVVDQDQWREMIAQLDPGSAVAGDSQLFAARDDLNFAARQGVDAVGVGLLAVRAFAIGDVADPLALIPRYLKPSAAEEKAAGR